MCTPVSSLTSLTAVSAGEGRGGEGRGGEGRGRGYSAVQYYICRKAEVFQLTYVFSMFREAAGKLPFGKLQVHVMRRVSLPHYPPHRGA